MHVLVAVAAAAVLACAGVDGVSFVTPCADGDNACVKQAAQAAVPVLAAGVPELGIPPTDPMHINRIKASQAGLNMDFRNTTVTGLKGCKVEKIERDKSERKLLLEIHCDVNIVGDYTLGGRLLVLPIEGDGRYKIKVRTFVVKISFDMADVVGADGETHWHISGHKHSYTALKGAEFRFQNLFKGNKALSDAIHSFANNSWKEILNEVGPPIVQVVVKRIVESIEIFFSKIPVRELALE